MADSANDGNNNNNNGGGGGGRNESQSPPAEAAAAGESEPPKLCDLLRDGLETLEEVETGGRSLSLVRRGLAAVEEASRLASRLGLFSSNETLEEVSTADLPYLLLPALQGALGMKLGETTTTANDEEEDSRLEALRGARAHFYAFLQRCRDLGVATFPMPRRGRSSGGGHGVEEEEESEEEVSPPSAAQRRQAKLERYRQRRDAEERIGALRAAVESGRADEGDVRDFHLLQARRWVALSLEEVESIDREMPLLLERKRRRRTQSAGADARSAERLDVANRPLERLNGANRPLERPNVANVARPSSFVLARGAVQAQVFGPGYPSPPSMTVEEWYEQHRAQGALPDRGIRVGTDTRRRRRHGEEEEEEEEEEVRGKEKDEDQEDEEALQKARDWDDWKDWHPRGYGNRHNRS